MQEPKLVDRREMRMRPSGEHTERHIPSYVARAIRREESTPTQYPYRSKAVSIRGE
jgi:hypothetical protein